MFMQDFCMFMHRENYLSTEMFSAKILSTKSLSAEMFSTETFK